MSRQHRSSKNGTTPSLTRRDFVKTSAAVTAASFAAPSVFAGGFHHRSKESLRVGLIGCGGRGTGAAFDALSASPDVHIVALGDVFEDRLNSCRNYLAERDSARATVAPERCFVGFDAYRNVIDDPEVDMVILATPPHFRPDHFEAAVDAGHHVFMEKPAAVDPVGIRKVLASSDEADRKDLSVVAGTQRRHEKCYLDLVERLRDGAIGEILTGRVSWNQEGLWAVEKQPAWSDMEWQLRNWLYFTWLSGDHIVEQHVHNLDVANWVMGGHPTKSLGMGGRQVRTDPVYGHIFDHFAVEYEYENGRFVEGFCRQINGCDSRVAENFVGSGGHCWSSSGWAQIHGENAWRSDKENPNPYVEEHKNLIASIRGEIGRINEGRQVAESTLTAIMGRMSAYTGKELTWEEALNSPLKLGPAIYEWGDLPVDPVPVPGKSQTTTTDE